MGFLFVPFISLINGEDNYMGNTLLMNIQRCDSCTESLLLKHVYVANLWENKHKQFKLL